MAAPSPNSTSWKSYRIVPEMKRLGSLVSELQVDERDKYRSLAQVR